AFAQLAEECRRAGQVEEAVDVCRAGLAIHPGYLSARVTLGRALIELNALDEAMDELLVVLRGAPENLAAIRGIAEIHHRRGELPDALAQYRVALGLARNDPDLQQTVAELARQVDPPPPPAAEEGLSFEQIANEFLNFAPPPPIPPSAASAPQVAPAPTIPTPAASAPQVAPPPAIPTLAASAPQAAPAPPVPVPAAPVAPPTPAEEAAAMEPQLAGLAEAPLPEVHAWAVPPDEPVAMAAQSPAHVESEHNWSTPVSPSLDDGARDEGMRTIAALERWLTAIHVTRADRSP
ncbi:MAG TPA: tetratricopeptide repeat protein, partial [Vicinamibacterales bacterium]|nr:tetratricopeptide repeat protein [Vicinamibacterales bacterium]